MDIIQRILFVVISLGFIYVLLKVILRKKIMQIMDKIGKENIILITSGANFFGQESAGLMQIRGNGFLVLTKDKLYFELILPKKIIEIPLEKIERIEESRSYLGKTAVSKLMKIIYRNESNIMDSCAWLVRHRKEWINKLEQLR